jgi:hypothetical protein
MRCTAFAGKQRIASGSLVEVALAVKARLAEDQNALILVFDDLTGEPIDLDLRGTDEEVVRRLDSHAVRRPGAVSHGPGRPRLGVVGREVTLLPRHWYWLDAQPGGASAALRRLVDAARSGTAARDQVRRAQESAYRFASAMAGNEAGYEEAIRALFAGDDARFAAQIAGWPEDIRDHCAKLAKNAFAAEAQDASPEL